MFSTVADFKSKMRLNPSALPRNKVKSNVERMVRLNFASLLHLHQQAIFRYSLSEVTQPTHDALSTLKLRLSNVRELYRR